MGKAPPFKPDRPDGQARTVLVSCRLTPRAASVLNNAAAKRGTSRADLIRYALEYYHDVGKMKP